VSQLNGQQIDAMSNLKFSPAFDFDDELHVYTVSLPEVGMYGVGATRDGAVVDLLDSIQEYLRVYVAKVTIFSKLEPVDKLFYILKLAQCNGDREAIRNEIGLPATPVRFDQEQIRRMLTYFQMAPIKPGGSIHVGIGKDGAWRACKFNYHEDGGQVTASAADLIAKSLKFKDAAEMSTFFNEQI
jgi:hypothetical protein